VRRFTIDQIGLIAFCAALNAGLGFLVQLLKLPIYLDLVGTIFASVLAGPLIAATTAVLGIILLGFLTVPTAFAYVGTAIIIAFAASWFSRFGYGRRLVPTIGFGLVLGLISALVSAPVTVFLFGGVSLVGADAVTAFFRALGETIYTSVILGGLATDPVDKLFVSLIVYSVVRSLPIRVLSHIENVTSKE
jgi:energy-coupling factor transport system substrate-specific component